MINPMFPGPVAWATINGMRMGANPKTTNPCMAYPQYHFSVFRCSMVYSFFIMFFGSIKSLLIEFSPLYHILVFIQSKRHSEGKSTLINEFIPMIQLQEGQFRSRFPKIKRYHTHGRTHRSAPTKA